MQLKVYSLLLTVSFLFPPRSSAWSLHDFGVVRVFGVLAAVGVWLVRIRAILIMDWHLGLPGRRGRPRRIRVWVSWEWDEIDKVACSILGLHVSVDLI